MLRRVYNLCREEVLDDVEQYKADVMRQIKQAKVLCEFEFDARLHHAFGILFSDPLVYVLYSGRLHALTIRCASFERLVLSVIVFCLAKSPFGAVSVFFGNQRAYDFLRNTSILELAYNPETADLALYISNRMCHLPVSICASYSFARLSRECKADPQRYAAAVAFVGANVHRGIERGGVSWCSYMDLAPKKNAPGGEQKRELSYQKRLLDLASEIALIPDAPNESHDVNFFEAICQLFEGNATHSGENETEKAEKEAIEQFSANIASEMVKPAIPPLPSLEDLEAWRTKEQNLASFQDQSEDRKEDSDSQNRRLVGNNLKIKEPPALMAPPQLPPPPNLQQLQYELQEEEITSPNFGNLKSELAEMKANSLLNVFKKPPPTININARPSCQEEIQTLQNGILRPELRDVYSEDEQSQELQPGSERYQEYAIAPPNTQGGQRGGENVNCHEKELPFTSPWIPPPVLPNNEISTLMTDRRNKETICSNGKETRRYKKADIINREDIFKSKGHSREYINPSLMQTLHCLFASESGNETNSATEMTNNLSVAYDRQSIHGSKAEPSISKGSSPNAVPPFKNPERSSIEFSACSVISVTNIEDLAFGSALLTKYGQSASLSNMDVQTWQCKLDSLLDELNKSSSHAPSADEVADEDKPESASIFPPSSVQKIITGGQCRNAQQALYSSLDVVETSNNGAYPVEQALFHLRTDECSRAVSLFTEEQENDVVSAYLNMLDANKTGTGTNPMKNPFFVDFGRHLTEDQECPPTISKIDQGISASTQNSLSVSFLSEDSQEITKRENWPPIENFSLDKVIAFQRECSMPRPPAFASANKYAESRRERGLFIAQKSRSRRWYMMKEYVKKKQALFREKLERKVSLQHRRIKQLRLRGIARRGVDGKTDETASTDANGDSAGCRTTVSASSKAKVVAKEETEKKGNPKGNSALNHEKGGAGTSKGNDTGEQKQAPKRQISGEQFKDAPKRGASKDNGRQMPPKPRIDAKSGQSEQPDISKRSSQKEPGSEVSISAQVNYTQPRETRQKLSMEEQLQNIMDAPYCVSNSVPVVLYKYTDGFDFIESFQASRGIAIEDLQEIERARKGLLEDPTDRYSSTDESVCSNNVDGKNYDKMLAAENVHHTEPGGNSLETDILALLIATSRANEADQVKELAEDVVEPQISTDVCKNEVEYDLEVGKDQNIRETLLTDKNKDVQSESNPDNEFSLASNMSYSSTETYYSQNDDEISWPAELFEGASDSASAEAYGTVAYQYKRSDKTPQSMTDMLLGAPYFSNEVRDVEMPKNFVKDTIAIRIDVDRRYANAVRRHIAGLPGALLEVVDCKK